MITLLQQVFWFSALIIVATTFGYPLLLFLSAPWAQRPRRFVDGEPMVTLIIAAYNEESCIARKLENALALDYPRDRLEIIVASDGSTDSTDAIVRSFSGRGVILRSFPRTGKTGIQNQVAAKAQGEILVFSDANAMYRPNAIRKLVRNFGDPEVACVCGQLVYATQDAGAGTSESLYWRYEKFMKQRESDLSSLIGANGSIYAVRNADYVQIDHDLISDLVEPLALVRNGKRVVYEPEAVSVEEASTSYEVEFRRKVRILTRSIRGVLRMRELLNPLRYGVFSFQLLMHKLMRYLIPLFLVMAGVSLTGLAFLGSYEVWFGLAAVAVTGGLLIGQGEGLRDPNLLIRLCQLFYYYLMVNYALALAWRNILAGFNMVLWVPERKDR